MVAVQEFRHMSQKPTELVADFIRRLEQAFRRAYGREPISTETRSALLQGQLQEGLRYALVTAPAVSGARTYQELCIAAKNEECRQLALSQRRLYKSEQDVASKGVYPGTSLITRPIQRNQRRQTEQRPQDRGESRRCYICNSPDHLAKQCKAHKTERAKEMLTVPPNKVNQLQPGKLRVIQVRTYPTQTIKMLNLV